MFFIRITMLSLCALLYLSACDSKGDNKEKEYQGFEKKYATDVDSSESGLGNEGEAPKFTDGSSDNVLIYGKTEGQLDLPNNPNVPGRSLPPGYMDFVIEGHIRKGANLELIIDELDGTEINPLRETIVNDSDYFRFEGSHKSPSLYQLRVPTGVIHLFVVSGTIKVETTYPHVGYYTLSGDGVKESQQLLDMYQILNDVNEKVDAVQERMDNLKDNHLIVQMYDSLPIIHRKLQAMKSQKLKTFIREIDKSLVAPLAAMRMDVAANIDFLDSLDQKFKRLYPGNKFVMQLDNKIGPYVMTAIGKKAPNIVLETPKKETLELESLQGKLVLIDFWASWCKPCRAQNPEMVKLYNKYKGRGFEIYGVSFDENKQDWVNAIKEDGLPWLHGSDLMGMEESPLRQVYLVAAIPKTVLVDRKGNIVAKDLHGAELEQAIKKYL